MTIVDDRVFVLGFNYTKQDIEKSRSFGITTRDGKVHKEALALFEADVTRQPYKSGHDLFVVSPEASREKLAELISSAKKQLLIYDDRVTDRLMLRLLKERAAAASRSASSGDSGSRSTESGSTTLRPPAARTRDHLRRHARVRGEPEPAKARAGLPARGRYHREGRQDREADGGGLRNGLEAVGRRQEG